MSDSFKEYGQLFFKQKNVYNVNKDSVFLKYIKYFFMCGK